MPNINNRKTGLGQEITFDNTDNLAKELSDRIAKKLTTAIETKGKASLLVSGGSTPSLLFEKLCLQDIDWKKVWISLVDERWVIASHEASNERLVRSHLLQSKAAAANFIPMVNYAYTAEAGAKVCSEMLSQIPEPFDMVLLGMGNDGHTASLFPCSEELALGLDLNSELRCLAVNPKTAPHARMSYTLPALLNSQQIILMLTGKAKWQVYQEAGSDDSKDAEKQMPIRAFLHQKNTKLDVYWAS